MTKKSIQTEIDRSTLAAELRRIAEQLDHGVLLVDNDAIPLGEPLFLKTKRKVKEGRAYLTFSCKIALTVPAEAPAREMAKQPAPARQRPRPVGMPAEAKAMKKEIARLWRGISGAINAGTPPAAAEAARLRRLMEEYRLYTPAAWAADWQACGAAVGQCLDAAAAGDLATARTRLTGINRQIKNCHTLHK